MKPLQRDAPDAELLALVERTATFWIVETPAGLILRLNDIHVM